MKRTITWGALALAVTLVCAQMAPAMACGSHGDKGKTPKPGNPDPAPAEPSS